MPTESIARIKPTARMSRAVVHAGVAYLCGHVAADPTAGVAGQTQQILTAIEATLALAGSEKAKLLSVSIWLADISTFDEMNDVYDAWVDRDNLPARATVEARLAGPEYKVEIAAIAAV